MGQCVTKCKNPSSSLGSKSGDKEPGSKSHHKKCGGTGGSGGGGHKEEPSGLSSKASSELMFNGTKNALEVTVETTVIPTSAMMGDLRNEERSVADREGPSLLRIEELFCCYKDPQEESILEEGMERFCNDLYVDPAEFRVLVLAWKFQAATMCKFTRLEMGCEWEGVEIRQRKRYINVLLPDIWRICSEKIQVKYWSKRDHISS